jgi:uncharacterized membrane protein YcaP (DUF421 family)
MEIVIRAAIVFAFLWLLTRAMGKRELAEISAFELILLVTIGDIVQQGITQEDMSLTGAVLSAGTIGLLTVTLSYLGFRWRQGRTFIEGMPVIIIREGRPLREVLKLERLTVEEVHKAARGQGIDDLGRVKVGILEPDGKFSFIRENDSGEDAPPDEDRGPVR